MRIRAFLLLSLLMAIVIVFSACGNDEAPRDDWEENLKDLPSDFNEKLEGDKSEETSVHTEESSAAESSEEQVPVSVGTERYSMAYFFLIGEDGLGSEGFDNFDIKQYDSAELAIEALVDGKINYVVINGTTADQLALSNELKVINIPLAPDNFGIAVAKAQPELLGEVNTVLSEESAEIEAIFEKYKDVDYTNAELWSGDIYISPEIDEAKDQLVVATNATYAPFTFKVGDGFAGIDIEISKLVADKLGKELVLVDMAFEDLIDSVGKNGIDMAAAAITISPDRETLVSFSAPYYTETYQIIICKKDDTAFDGCETAEDLMAVLNSFNRG